MRYNARLSERPSQRTGGDSLTLAECLDQIANSPRTARGLNQRLSEANDRIVMVENRSSRGHRSCKDADNQTAESSVNSPYLATKNPRLQHQFCSPLGLGDLPFIVGRRPTAAEGLPPWQPDLELNDTAPFRLSRNHFAIEKHDGGYRVRDLCSTLGTIVNGEPIGHYVHADASTAWGHLVSDAPLRAGENEVIAGGADSPFVFSVFIPSRLGGEMAGKHCYHLGFIDKNTVAVKRLLIVLALSVLASGCGLPMGRDVRAYNTCLSRHPHDTVVCEGPRQAYELDPSIVQLRSVASRPAAGYGY
jgi:CRP/FNR family cyclic AMP-dependent transcriptional regulator